MTRRGPASPESIRDAAALLVAVVTCDEDGVNAILTNCDKDQVVLALAGMTAMYAREATGVDQAGLVEMPSSFARDIAAATSKGVQG